MVDHLLASKSNSKQTNFSPRKHHWQKEIFFYQGSKRSSKRSKISSFGAVYNVLHYDVDSNPNADIGCFRTIIKIESAKKLCSFLRISFFPAPVSLRFIPPWVWQSLFRCVTHNENTETFTGKLSCIKIFFSFYFSEGSGLTILENKIPHKSDQIR